MVLNNRLITSREAFLHLISFLYMMFGFTSALVFGLLSLITLPSFIHDPDHSMVMFCALMWSGVLIPIGIKVFLKRRCRNQLTTIVNTLRHPQYFCPESHMEMFRTKDGKYLGIDTKHGTILYVHRIRKGTVDVVGLTSEDWFNLEAQGGKLRISTKLVDLPRIEFTTRWADRWYDTLNSMQYTKYSTPHSFAEFVESYTQRIERENNVQILKIV